VADRAPKLAVDGTSKHIRGRATHELAGRRAFVAGSLALLVRPALADDRHARIAAAVDAAIRPLMARHDVPGMALGLTLQGQRYVFHYGVASRESNSPVTADTLFEIGSLSMTFTATVATYAQALGKLSLAESPGQRMPALRGTPVDAATLLQLGTYTAGGLPLQFPDTVRSFADAVAFFRAWRPSAPPGQQRCYSNPSIGLLGHIAALAMQQHFSALSQQLFARLGLRQTFLRVPAARAHDYAWGYDKANQPIHVNPGVFDAQAYGVKTTSGDLLRFLEANIDPSALEPTLRRAVLATHVAHFQVGPMAQGLGWEQYPFPVSLQRLQAGNASTMALEAHAAQALAPGQAPPGPALFDKTGSTNGFGAYAAFVPSQRTGIVMLANRNVPVPARIAAAHAVLQQVS